MKQQYIKLIEILLLVVAVFLIISCIFIPEEKTEITDKLKGTLVWSDEFDYSGMPNSSKWKYEIGASGWGNNEIQNYQSNTSNDVAYVSDGTLKIKAYKDGSTWKSARMNSIQNWKYGYIEASMKVTNLNGFWPAFWMMPSESIYGGWPGCGEIDIMENAPAVCGANRVFSSLHAANHSGSDAKSIGSSSSLEDLSSTWHTFGIKWTESQITAYYDGVEQGTYNNDGTGYENWPYDQNFFIILNLAVGGNLGGAGYDNYDEAFLELDYVRVYE